MKDLFIKTVADNVRILKKIKAGHYAAYTSGASEPFASIVRVRSRCWRVFDYYRGVQFDFGSLTQCKVYLGID